MSVGNESKELFPERPPRHPIHLLMQIQKFRWFSWNPVNAALLDISHAGFKASITGDSLLTPGKFYWGVFPLSQVNPAASRQWFLYFECRWFNQGEQNFGGRFHKITETDKAQITYFVNFIKEQE